MIRPAVPADVPVLIDLIRELAEYEKAPQEAKATPGQLHEALFGPRPTAYAHLAADDETGEPAGMAVWFLNFSTWQGVPGIYLEDLYVRPAARGRGHGRALLRELARICGERGYPRLQWWVLNWNTPALDFYRSLGARPMSEWTVYRLDGDGLASLSSAPA
jgi:GNAT superfamily N-acetyltransferase